ncbi:MAG: DUF362 domain-containing protein [Syntrophales bacterium]|jgi:uncharacterized protein (DUF362 family)|nr:DUF362 domain-containing protein [Syntrophales bacterium]
MRRRDFLKGAAAVSALAVFGSGESSVASKDIPQGRPSAAYRHTRVVLAGATLGMKAAVGYWRTDTRLEYHRDAATFHEKTAEANTARTLLQKQRLVISAADKILTTFGPDKGHVHQPPTGLVIASESVVAHDMVSLAWLMENRRNIPADKK